MLNAGEKRALQARMQRFIGKEIGPAVTGRDPVNLPMIRQWCDAMGDSNPLYNDAAAARQTPHGELKAPPTMLDVWTMGGWEMHRGYETPQDEQQRLHQLLTDAGYSGVLGTNTEQEFRRYLREGDVISARTIIADISEEKATGVGVGYFITTRTEFSDAKGEQVGWMTFRVLKFIPQQAAQQAGEGAEQKSAAQKPARLKPPMGHDNAWWWQNIAKGELTVQRCGACKKLRHPPRPMCPDCNSMKWEAAPLCGRGTLHTFTVIHHPQFPGYEFPICAALVDLEEGVRMVSNVTGCPPEQLQIGMALQGYIHEDEDGFKLPLFRPVNNKAAAQ